MTNATNTASDQSKNHNKLWIFDKLKQIPSHKCPRRKQIVDNGRKTEIFQKPVPQKKRKN